MLVVLCMPASSDACSLGSQTLSEPLQELEVLWAVIVNSQFSSVFPFLMVVGSVQGPRLKGLTKAQRSLADSAPLFIIKTHLGTVLDSAVSGKGWETQSPGEGLSKWPQRTTAQELASWSNTDQASEVLEPHKAFLSSSPAGPLHSQEYFP